MSAAEQAVAYGQSGMVVGLGHGSTAIFALERLAERLSSRAGIVAHGLFLGLATEAIVAGPAGAQRLTRPQQPSPGAQDRREPFRPKEN